MSQGRKVFAILHTTDEHLKVELNDNRYETMISKDGVFCIVEKKSQPFVAISDVNKKEDCVK